MVEELASDLTSAQFIEPDNIPFTARALATAAIEHRAALAPVGREGAHQILVGLRSSTLPQQGTDEEIKLSFSMLRHHLAEIPADILKQACATYIRCRVPCYFPRSPSEILAYANPLIFDRKRNAYRLDKLSKIRAERDAESERLKLNTLDPDDVDEANSLMARVGARTRYHPDGSPYQLNDKDLNDLRKSSNDQKLGEMDA